MFSKLFVTALVAALATVHADPDPSAPGPGDIFNEGTNCTISWAPDTTGTWKQMNIELMSGSNLQMNHLTTVATVDGTDAATTTYSYACPEVTPNSAIYFYQFTSPEAKATYWTTRFTIADNNGHADPPANPTQANGDAIPWGVGALVNPSLATPPPPAAGSALGAGSASNSTSSASDAPPVSSSSGSGSSPASPPVTTPTPAAQQKNANTTTSSGVSASASPSGAGGAAAQNNAAGTLYIPSVVTGALALMGLTFML
ncbi:hypothetical protein EUX98_g7028 [Antrodiella citrinella]|uniref:Yeast cell wall synthesis Kre9/Knh1-like N-terminal domain-containing protein n=1 Tax=Antrodiella citrinella TaxID=2447956 RepID=A0A4S4MND0_9APHY|nr:hypothetical protein EUX98_g7028 [Antrodiella citrinella]